LFSFHKGVELLQTTLPTLLQMVTATEVRCLEAEVEEAQPTNPQEPTPLDQNMKLHNRYLSSKESTHLIHRKPP